MPKAALTDEMKKIIREKYDNTEPKMKTADLSKWATKELGKPISPAVCNAIKKTSKREKERLENPGRAAFEEFVAFQAKVSFNSQRQYASRSDIIEIAKYCTGIDFFEKENIPALNSNWLSILRDSYGLPKNARALTGGFFAIPSTAAERRAQDRRIQMQADFRLRPKVLTPYSWEFIEEKYLYNWANADSGLSFSKLQDESLKFLLKERPQAPPLQVYKMPYERQSPDFDEIQ